ncbi:hypothetical protein RMN57_07015 [Kitasatospora sp. CM 4170]|uniref:Chlorite dismutase n=1 Tax=Kitasatospora aburaviensis TaxID=67265 RepID=A0ABW1ERA8_9ACTN|nr:hypothetical protein [Kitasatospora sp. CM 4170]WNM44477.1 hypothetical protein RMN57_07015 [Kitasatospora sp. CM 4170]
MAPSLLYPAAEYLPTGADREPALKEVLDWADRAAATTTDDALLSFFGQPLDARTLRLTGLHHVAVYLGDYRREEDFEAWLETVREHPGLSRVSSGPSHIAPRVHGTPGHWINLTTERGTEVEFFTCRAYGEWAGLPADRKSSLMSHLGLSVDTADQVRRVLDYLAGFDSVELLAYAPEDELGHTYGHLLRTDTERVLELVHAGRSHA